MKKALSVLVLFVVAVVLMGQAELPKRKAGLWEISMVIEGTKAAIPSAKMCIDAATDAEFYKMGSGISRDACSKRELKVNGKTITVDSVCSFAANRTSTTHATTTFTGDTAYHTEMQMHYEPPLMGKSDSAMSQDGKWVGACPADMQPGDMLMPGGVKLNVRDLKAP